METNEDTKRKYYKLCIDTNSFVYSISPVEALALPQSETTKNIKCFFFTKKIDAENFASIYEEACLEINEKYEKLKKFIYFVAGTVIFLCGCSFFF